MRWLKTRASFVFIEGETLSYRHGIVAFNEPWKSPAPPVQLVSVSIAQIILTLPRSTLLKLTYLSI